MPRAASATMIPANTSLRWRSVRSTAEALPGSAARPRPGHSLVRLVSVRGALHRTQPERDRWPVAPAGRPAPERRRGRAGAAAGGFRTGALPWHTRGRVARPAPHRAAVWAAGPSGGAVTAPRAPGTAGTPGTATAEQAATAPADSGTSAVARAGTSTVS